MKRRLEAQGSRKDAAPERSPRASIPTTPGPRPHFLAFFAASFAAFSASRARRASRSFTMRSISIIGFTLTALGRASGLRPSATFTGMDALAPSTSTLAVVYPGPVGHTCPRWSPRHTSSLAQVTTAVRPTTGAP